MVISVGRWRDLCRAVDGLRYDIPVAAEPSSCVSVGCICVEVSDVVRVYVRFHDAGAMGGDSVRWVWRRDGDLVGLNGFGFHSW